MGEETVIEATKVSPLYVDKMQLPKKFKPPSCIDLIDKAQNIIMLQSNKDDVEAVSEENELKSSNDDRQGRLNNKNKI